MRLASNIRCLQFRRDMFCSTLAALTIVNVAALLLQTLKRLEVL